jgi:hypothetical protein
MLQDWMVTRIPALISGGIMETAGAVLERRRENRRFFTGIEAVGFHRYYLIYRVLTEQFFTHLPKTIIAIDWSPMYLDQSSHLLRAAIPPGGRSLSLP